MRVPVSRLVRTATVLITIVGVGGCASTPDAPGRDLVAAGIADRTSIDAGALPAPAEWTAPPGVTLDDGLTMDEAAAAALWNNPDFQVALASLGLARADLVEAGLIRNPILSLLFPVGPKQLEWTLSWPVDVLWQRPRRIEAAGFAADAVAEQLVAHGVRLVAEVKLAWIDVEAAEASLGFAAEQAALARQLAGLADGRLRAGDISDFDARLVRTDAARLEAARLARRSARDLALLRLRTLMGLDASAPPIELAPAPEIAAAACGQRAALVETALAARPEVRAAEIDLEAAAARAGVERTRIMTLSAMLDANAEGREGYEMGPGLAAELPILSQNQGGKARAAAELEQTGRRYLAVRATIVAAVDDARIRLDEAESAMRVFDDAIGTSLDTERRQAEQLYEAGEISLLDLLQTRQRLIDADATRLDADAAARRARIRLEEAIGRSCEAR